jgi:hypothetical protein
MVYHSIVDQKMSFQIVFEILRDFLSQNPSEFVLMRLKNEQKNCSKIHNERFSSTFKQIAMLPVHKNFWYLESNMPKISDLRGKIWLLN